MSDMKKATVILLLLALLSLHVFAEEIETDLIIIGELHDTGESASVVRHGDGYALSFTEIRIDISNKYITGDVMFEFESSESAKVTVTFSGSGESKFVFDLQDDQNLSFLAEKAGIEAGSGSHPSYLTLTADPEVLLTRIICKRSPQSVVIPITAAAVFLLLAFIIPALFYIIKSRRKHRKRFI